jgi:hypothetical protein
MKKERIIINNNTITGNFFRFTILTERLVRLEYSDTGKFEDRKTQLVQNRDFENSKFNVYENNKDNLLEIVTDYFHLYYKGGNFSEQTLYINLKYNYNTFLSRWYFGEKIKHNLFGTAETLDGADGADGAVELGIGIQNKDGFSFLDDTDSIPVMKKYEV